MRDLDNFNHTVFHDDVDFKPIRKEILKEDNWLRNNYTEENLVIDNHIGFSVIWHKSGSLFGVGGLYELNPNVGRHLNRVYTFPEWRSRKSSELIRNFQVAQVHMVEPLEAIKQYDGYVITMQNRNRPNKNWWKHWKKNALVGLKGWQETEGYIRTCKSKRNVCFQNYVYRGVLKNVELITEEEWLKLES